MKKLDLPKERTFVGPALVWKRVIAFMVDMLIINIVVLFPFRGLFEDILPKDYSFSEAYRFLSSSANYAGFLTSVSLVMSILVIMYFYLMERKMSQTIGKMLMKIYVADASENASSRSTGDNKDLKPWQLLARNIVFIPLFPFVLLWVLDPLFMFFTKTNQRLSEVLSKTKVVERYSLEQ
ncbi:RDD family protein [Candidatus Woesearchaeota archaeon]|nr:RDD family protein [Candidatus Woesearchaeota archaeon]